MLQKMFAIGSIVSGFAIVLIFAGKLLAQIAAIIIGSFMIRYGIIALNHAFSFKVIFRSFIHGRNR